MWKGSHNPILRDVLSMVIKSLTSPGMILHQNPPEIWLQKGPQVPPPPPFLKAPCWSKQLTFLPLGRWPLAVYLRPTRQWRKRREWSWFWGGGRGVTPFLLEPNVYTPENQCLAKKPPKLYRFWKMICSAVFVSGALFRPCLLQISLGRSSMSRKYH